MKKLNDLGAAFLRSVTRRGFRAGSYGAAVSAVVIAIAVAVNVLAASLPSKYTQFDTTAGSMFTLSEETKELAAALEEDVTVYHIVQSGYEDSAVEQLLQRYADLTDRIKVEKIDPDVYPAFVTQYVSEGVYNNSLIVELGGRHRYISYYDIYLYDYSEYYTTGTVNQSFAGEAELTSAIDYVTRAEMPKLYTLTGHGESELPTDFSSAVTRQNYEMESLTLVSAGSVPEDADGLLIYAPQKDISEGELELLRSYLREGGKLYLITQPTVEPLEHLNLLMADYGLSAVEGIVVEGDSSYYAWSGPYDLLPDLGDHAITEALLTNGYYVRVPVAHGIAPGETPDGVTVTQLLTTSGSAYNKAAGYNMATYEKEAGDEEGSFTLSVAVEDTNSGAAVVWVTSGYLADSQTNSEVAGGNLDFFLNGLGWLCSGGESELSIHAKAMDYSYLTMSEGTASLLTMLVVLVIPALYVLTGLLIRRRRKRA